MAAKPDGEAALPAGEGLSVVADCEKPPVGDGEAEAALFAGAVSQGAAMVLNVPVLGCFATGLGIGDAFESCRTSFLQSLIGFPSLLAAFLVDVVGCVGFLPVGLPPSGDALVERRRDGSCRCVWAGWVPG